MYSLSSNITSAQSNFSANSAEFSGGAIYANVSSLELTNNRIFECLAGNGGALFAQQTKVSAFSSTFWGNKVEAIGGGA